MIFILTLVWAFVSLGRPATEQEPRIALRSQPVEELEPFEPARPIGHLFFKEAKNDFYYYRVAPNANDPAGTRLVAGRLERVTQESMEFTTVIDGRRSTIWCSADCTVAVTDGRFTNAVVEGTVLWMMVQDANNRNIDAHGCIQNRDGWCNDPHDRDAKNVRDANN